MLNKPWQSVGSVPILQRNGDDNPVFTQWFLGRSSRIFKLMPSKNKCCNCQPEREFLNEVSKLQRKKSLLYRTVWKRTSDGDVESARPAARLESSLCRDENVFM